jgi:membrane associated rhomboid family serine protease
MWFMAAALIPLLFIIGNFLSLASESDTLELVIWFMLVPLLLSGLLGSLIGAGILDPFKVSSGWHAALRGFVISVLAFLISSIGRAQQRLHLRSALLQQHLQLL